MRIYFNGYSMKIRYLRHFFTSLSIILLYIINVLSSIHKLYNVGGTGLCILHIDIVLSIVHNIDTVKGKPKTNKKQEVSKMSVNEMTKKVRELKELKAMAEELAAEISTIEDEIKQEMLTQGVDEMQVDVFKIRYKTVVSSRFDSKAFKATHAELYSQYTKQTESRRFTVA